MKKAFIPSLIAFALLTFSCVNKEKKSPEALEPVNETVDMTVKFIYDKEDIFKVYYTKTADASIDGSLLLTLPVHASKSEQEITFVFPIGDAPKLIRLDVGSNQAAESIEIKNIKISHGDNIIDNSDWVTNTNWSPNESLIFDVNSKVYKIVAIKGTKSPVFMSNNVVKDEIANYFKKE